MDVLLTGHVASPETEMKNLVLLSSILLFHHFSFKLCFFFYRIPEDPFQLFALICTLNSFIYIIVSPHFTMIPRCIPHIAPLSVPPAVQLDKCRKVFAQAEIVTEMFTKCSVVGGGNIFSCAVLYGCMLST